MGKVTSETLGLTSNHFSHNHPLKLINHGNHTTTPSPPPPPSCAACNLHPSGLIYTCTTCPFFLHKKCFEMPNKITHPCHNAHPLTLLAKPSYPDGLFNCDGCGEHGNGFSYHCKPCGVDYHILCVVKPLSVIHGFHAHKLDLTFQSPYGPVPFCCDICKVNGSSNWLYRCHSCGFDAHLKCASSPVKPPPPPRQVSNFQSQVRSAADPYQIMMNATQMQQNAFLQNSATGIPVASPIIAPQVGVNSNELVMQAILQMARNNNAITQAYLASALRGGTAGESQQMMQMISAMNRMNGLGGGGGTNILQTLGGGNGVDVGGLLGGGAGGGLDLSSLLGGVDLAGLLGGFSF